MHVEDPRFPPLLTGYGVKAPERAFTSACRGAAAGTYGAADVVWARDARRVELALVLEPDVPRHQALQMVPLFQLAVIEAIGALMPPKTSVLLRWPDTLLINGGAAGDFRFMVAKCADDAVPDWLVAGIEIQLAPRDSKIEPGDARDETCLQAEGSDERTRSDFLEVIGSFTLSWIDSWQDAGLAAIAQNWIGRLEGHDSTALIALEGRDSRGVLGRVLGLDEDLQLLVKPDSGDILTLRVADLVADDTAAARVGAETS